MQVHGELNALEEDSASVPRRQRRQHLRYGFVWRIDDSVRDHFSKRLLHLWYPDRIARETPNVAEGAAKDMHRESRS